MGGDSGAAHQLCFQALPSQGYASGIMAFVSFVLLGIITAVVLLLTHRI